MRNKAIELLKALLVNHKETHIRWQKFLSANPDQEENHNKSAGGIKHHEKCIREYEEALQALAELEQQPEPTEVSKSYGRVLDAVVAAFATTDDEIIQQKVQVAVDQGRKVCRELDLQAEENKRLRELLKDAKCSNKFCRNGTIIPPIGMPYTCKWCKAKAQALQESEATDGEQKVNSKAAD